VKSGLLSLSFGVMISANIIILILPIISIFGALLWLLLITW